MSGVCQGRGKMPKKIVNLVTMDTPLTLNGMALQNPTFQVFRIRFIIVMSIEIQ